MANDSFGSKWIEINLDHWESNLNWIRDRVKPAKVLPVIKANAYGHGAIKMAQVCERIGITSVIVASLREALELRRNYIQTQILVLGVVPSTQIADLINYRITPTICRFEDALALQKHAERVGQKISAHVYVDTGMGRMGQTPEGLLKLFEDLKTLKNIHVEALYSHFAVSDELDEESVAFTEMQWLRLSDSYKKLDQTGLKLHMANSAGVLKQSQAWADFVRPGLLCYGILPVAEDDELSELKPVMSIKVRPSFIKRMKQGESVGYGRIFKLDRDTNIMTLPVGYADGIPRRLGQKLKVCAKGKVFPVVGRVCMDMLMVDLGDAKITLDDEVILMGDGAPSVDDWAKWSDTIPYEILTQLGRRWNYVYKRGQKVEEIVLSDS